MNVGALALYLSTFGSGVLKAMSGDQAKIIINYDEAAKEGYTIDGAHLPVAEDDNTHTEDHSTDIQESYSEKSGSAEVLKAFEEFEANNMKEDRSSIGQITAAQLLENPELITLVDNHRDQNSPINILEQISPAGKFSYGEVHLSFVVDDNNMVHIDNLSADNNSIIRLDQALEKYEIVIREFNSQGIPLEWFLEIEDDLVKVFSENLGVPAEELMAYADHVIMPDTSQIEIVKFEDFHVPVDKDNIETIHLKEMKEDIYIKHGLDTFGQIVIDEELSQEIEKITNKDGLVDYTAQEAREKFLQHIQEERLDAAKAEVQERLEANGISTGYDDYDIILKRVSHDSDTSHLKAKIANLGINEIQADSYKNGDEFQEMFLKALTEDGYPLPELEKIAQENPKKVVEIVSQTIGNHMNYSNLEAKQMDREIAYTNLDTLHQELKHQSMPAATLGTGAGVCHDYATTMSAGLNVLEKLGISNMDNMAVMTTTLAGVHEYILLATYEGDAVRVSLVDPTFADNGSDFDAVDKNHSYHGVSPEIYKWQKEKIEERAAEKEAEKISAHNELQRRIELNNFFAFQQRIIDFITRYYPEKTHGRKIQVDKDSYQAIQKHEQELAEVRQKISKTDSGFMNVFINENLDPALSKTKKE